MFSRTVPRKRTGSRGTMPIWRCRPRRLPPAAGPDESDALPRRHLQADVAQHRLLRVWSAGVTEGDVAVGHPAGDVLQFDAVGRIFAGGALGPHLPDPPEGAQGLGD